MPYSNWHEVMLPALSAASGSRKTCRSWQTGQTQILTLTTNDGQINLLADPDGAPSYTDLPTNANEIDIDGITVRVAWIDDLLAMKHAAGGPQDLIDIESLEIARRRGRRKPKR